MITAEHVAPEGTDDGWRCVGHGAVKFYEYTGIAARDTELSRSDD